MPRTIPLILSANDQVQIQQWVAAHGPRNYERHRHQEFVKFLRRLDQEVPHDHAITLGYGQLRGMPTHPKVQAWLAIPASVRTSCRQAPAGSI
jgi:hypothetical protein